MKNTLVVILLLISSPLIAKPAARYCELAVYQPGFRRYVAEVNYSNVPKPKFDAIRDNAGKKIRFASRLDALNFFTRDGWELVSVSRAQHNGATHFFLRK